MSPAPTDLSASQARRLALAAQGLQTAPRSGTPTMRSLQRVVDTIGLIQVDSVNVLARAHLLPLYSRLGPYDVDLLRRAAEASPRRLVEYWAHMQALMPVELWPLMAARREHYRRLRGKWWHDVPEDVLGVIRDDVRAHGPSTAREVSARLGHDAERPRGHWGWNWSIARKALDHLFTTGEVAVAGRTSAFEVRYDTPERVLPAAVLALPEPSHEEAHRLLVERAARAHGVATLGCLRDYHRMDDLAAVRTAVAELVEDAVLEPVRIEGWTRPAWRHRDARLPRAAGAATLLSPFDPLVWERERVRRLFGFDYRIEIYVPAARRRHGYYVLPFLLGERLVARVDLKADRARGVLRVLAAHGEDDAPAATAAALAVELERMAGWLGLERVEVERRGDLAAPLAAEAGH
ncbi:winged helix DNA-binding domain-containing protein [Nocardioides sp. TRM66260-LWL]|uniref:winged helix-turn-helix domain-containing protein n=1 Tax=Nocardioides sp. TRM66260-LWL TaxID=2874478 RepID=UPI001CC41D97|nr:crosslink repair DNA glycosylase YcaQ family protein [Nocardioides sp. TRM66260-LWL]MBZ5734198.1 winged helix DNA-binding domain-containing protein [Nocardioides sp. TRM66260-LWL]